MIEDITVDELINALVKAREDGDADAIGAGWMTTKEMARATSRNERWVIKKLAMLKENDKLETARVSRESIDGRMVTVPAYRMKQD